MSIISRQELIDGKWFTWGSLDGSDSTIFETDYKPEENEILDKLNAMKVLEDGTTN